jgi:hypothetical protein
MIILILLGLVQALILPGLLFSYYAKSIDFKDRIILTGTLSLLANYLIVWCLYVSNLYSQLSLLLIFSIECLWAFKIRLLIYKDITELFKYLIKTFQSIITKKTINLNHLFFILFCIYYLYLLKTNGFLTVFTHWDAVVSWNRWALELHEGTFQGSRGYPLAISILFSIIYTVANETNIQTLVKYVCVFWPFLGGLAIFACGLHAPKYKFIFSLSSIIYLYFLSKGSWTIDFIFSGLVDPMMAAYGAIFIYSCLFISSRFTKDNADYKQIITLTLLSILGSSLIKLTGVILTFYFIIFIAFIVFTNNKLKNQKIFFIILFIITCAIAVHWYAITTFYWRDWQVLSEYSSLQDPRIWIRPYLHLKLFGFTFGWTFTILLFLGALSSKKTFALFILFIIPLFLFCGITVGYDLRASFILFAPIAILSILGLLFIKNFLINFYLKIVSIFQLGSKIFICLMSVIALTILTVVIFSLTSIMSKERILYSNTEKRIFTNDFANQGNKKLLSIFETEPNARIISCWQTPIGLPGAKGKFIPTGNCTITLLQSWLSDPNTKYWLYRDEGSAAQPLKPDFVTDFLSKQPIKIHAENLGSGFVLYSKY